MRLFILALSLATTTACLDQDCRQSDVDRLVVPDAARLNAVAFVGDFGESLAVVGDDGLVSINREPANGGRFTTTRPVDVDLHGITGGPGGLIFAVGKAGTVLGATHGSAAWEALPSGTTADLWAVKSIAVDTTEHLLAVGDEVILHRDPLTSQWSPLAVPEGGWGRLRALASAGPRIYAVGLAGTVWSTLAPQGAWTREDIGTDVDLFAATGTFFGDDLIVAGAAGTALRRSTDWQPVRGDFRGDLIAADGDHILASDGHVFEIPTFFADEPERSAQRLRWSLPGARTLRADGELALVGEDGLAAQVPIYCYRGD